MNIDFKILFSLINITLILTENSPEHRKGHCVMKGQCGSEDNGLFSRPLNCLYNEEAPKPSLELKEQYNNICGILPLPTNSGLCCSSEQLGTLDQNLKMLEALVGQCPACKNNLNRLFCSLTCSADQANFMNVTKIAISNLNKTIVTELDFYVNEVFGKQIYNSCKGVKLSSSNSFAMDFIAPGASTYLDLLKSIGKKSSIGSPFQINFPTDNRLNKLDAKGDICYTNNTYTRCSCIDCDKVCPVLPDIKVEKKVWEYNCGPTKCYTLFLTLIYAVLVLVGLSSLRSKMKMFIVSHISRNNRLKNIFRFSGNKITTYLKSDYILKNISEKSYHNKKTTFTCFIIFLIISLSGIYMLNYETEPAKLWTEKNSLIAKEKDNFDTIFGPFYRTQQIIISSKDNSVVNSENIIRIFDIINDIKRIESKKGMKLDNFCFRPLNKGCLIQSITNYWNDEKQEFIHLGEKSRYKQLQNCVSNPTSCIPSSGIPTKSEFIFGGELIKNNNNYTDIMNTSNALIISFILKNSKDKSYIDSVSMWEKSLIEYLIKKKLNFSNKYNFDFTTESSLEIELNKSTNTDIKIVCLSYLAMFIYIIISMSKIRYSIQNKKLYFRSKFWLSCGGIILVLLSVLCSFGICSLINIKTTLITAEVVPFLVLAIGVDNIFLLINEKENLKNQSYVSILDESPDDDDSEIVLENRFDLNQVKTSVDAVKAVSNLAPSMLSSSICEIFTFFIASFVKMPAVNSFAIYAAVAILINFVFQITIFTILLDIEDKLEFFDIDKILSKAGVTSVVPTFDEYDTDNTESSTLHKFFEKYYTALLFRTLFKRFVFYGFLLFFIFNIYLLPKIELGLEQKISFPKESYIVDYFDSVDKYLRIGPPVYFVAKKNIGNPGVTTRPIQQQFCSRFTTCNQYSLPNILEQERKRIQESYISQPSSGFIDDFFYWLNPSNDRCCTMNSKGELCDPDFDTDCQPCLKGRHPSWNITMEGFPENDEFMQYLKLWLNFTPTDECPLGGKGAYSDSVYSSDKEIIGFNFRTYHPPLKQQADYIEAYKQSRRISKEFKQYPENQSDYEIFPYSLFYIYFDQYSYISGLAWKLLSLCIFSIGLINYVMLRSIRITFINILTTTMVVVGTSGVSMIILSYIQPNESRIMLNAVSLVNLIITVGISVEFISHLSFDFTKNVNSPSFGQSKEEAIKHSLTNKGKSVFTGIALTKFIGIVVLAFTRSQIFRIYYFKMYMVMIVVCTLHGFLFLPVILEMFGPNHNTYNIIDIYED